MIDRKITYLCVVGVAACAFLLPMILLTPHDLHYGVGSLTALVVLVVSVIAIFGNFTHVGTCSVV